jgi:PAS domain S-box-containing protein
LKGRTKTDREWAARLEVVAELASLINTTFDLDEIFRAAILKIAGVLEFRRASVVLVAADRTHYYLHTLYDRARGGFIEGEGRYPLECGLTGQAIRTGEAMRVDTFAGTEGIRTSGEGEVSALIVPIKLDGEVIGTLNFGAEQSRRYEDEDLELAVLFGRQIATALHYSKLLATIRKQREEIAAEHARVASQRARLEALIDASDAAILMVSEGRVAYANQSMATLLGLPREVLLGTPIEEIDRVLARSLSDPEALRRQQEVLASGEGALQDRVEFQFPRRLICQRTVTTVRADDEVLGHLVLYRDVTREAEAEAAKSEFVSIVSHELRTPLTSVKTSLGLLLKGAGGAVSDKARELLEIALRNLDRLIRLVDDLLDLSRIESGHIEMELAPISLEDAVGKAIAAVEAFAHERGVAIEIADASPGAAVVADADRLQQVIVNLLTNAVKFSPEGERVELRWWCQSEYAVLEIADRGPGIPADQLEEIFDKFRQLEQAATRRAGGAGLGLAISRRLVDQMGGSLWAESEVGVGSRFFVRLRLAHTGVVEAEARPEAAPAGPGAVLLVESDPDLQRLFRDQFEAEGWTVRVCSRGEEALDLAGRERPDLIVVSLELGDMHGLEFLQRLRSSPKTIDVPTLLVGPGGDLRQAVSYGADGWVVGDADGLIAEANRLISAPSRPVVLIIEDDPAVRMGLARGLRRAGYACLEAASGEAGLEMARARRPDLVLTDIQIPGKDGLMVLQEFRSDPDLADVPAIVITGHAAPDLVKTIESLHARFLPKPFGTSTVLREIGQLIGSPNTAR